MNNQTLLTPEQYFNAKSIAGDYIRKEDFLDYCKELSETAFDAGRALADNPSGFQHYKYRSFDEYAKSIQQQFNITI